MTNTPAAPAPFGLPVTTSITASAADECPVGTCNGQNNHAEGIVVSTALVAGFEPGERKQHAEGIVLCTAIAAGGEKGQHAEGVVVDRDHGRRVGLHVRLLR